MDRVAEAAGGRPRLPCISSRALWNDATAAAPMTGGELMQAVLIVLGSVVAVVLLFTLVCQLRIWHYEKLIARTEKRLVFLKRLIWIAQEFTRK